MPGVGDVSTGRGCGAGAAAADGFGLPPELTHEAASENTTKASAPSPTDGGSRNGMPSVLRSISGLTSSSELSNMQCSMRAATSFHAVGWEQSVVPFTRYVNSILDGGVTGACRGNGAGPSARGPSR